MNELLSRIVSPISLTVWIGVIALHVFSGRVLKRRIAQARPTLAPRIMRYLVLPAALVQLVSRLVLQLPAEHLVSKLTSTMLAILLMSFAFNAIHYLFFSEHNILTGKESIPKLGRDVLNFVMTLLVAACVLSWIWGLDLANLITALGVSSLVIGLALQEPLGNLFNGISLLTARPFRKGDWVEIEGERGKVVDITWRAVMLVNRANELVIVPNNKMGTESFKNLSRPSRIHAELVTIGFSYEDRPADVKAVLLKMALATQGVLAEPPPAPLTLSYGDFYIEYGLRVFVEDIEDAVHVKDRLMTQFFDTAQASGLSIPYPRQDVTLHELAHQGASQRAHSQSR